MEDVELIRRVVDEDDLEAYGLLVRRHQDKVFGLALSVLGPTRRADAEDVAQEALLRAYRQLPGFRREARFTSWLYRITRNLAIDALRRPHRSRPHVGLQELVGLSAGERGDPEAGAMAAERTRRVERCLKRLPPRWQATFRLHYWMGMTVAEIAEQIGRAPGTVKAWLHRGRKLLAVCLENDHTEER